MAARSSSPQNRAIAWAVGVAVLAGCSSGAGSTTASGSTPSAPACAASSAAASPASSSQTPAPSAHVTAHPGAHHVAADLGQKIDAYFAADTTGHYRNRRAVIVTVDGNLAATRYVKSTATTTFDIQTIGWTIVTILAGIAVDEGKIHSLDQTLPELLPTYASVMTAEDKTITLRQLVTQTSGLATDDVFYPQVWGTKKDWVRQILTDGSSPNTGTLSGSSAAAHLVSVIISQATGQSTLDYARTKLFTPLGIATAPAYVCPFLPADFPAYAKAGFAWPTDPQGHNLGAGSIKMTGLDLAKIGQLMLDRGAWHGKRLVSAAWMTHMESPLQIIGTEADGAPIGFGYNNVLGAKITGHYVYATLALGGQIIEVVPDLGAVVTVLSQSPINPLEPAEAGTTSDGSDYDDFVSTVVEPSIH